MSPQPGRYFNNPNNRKPGRGKAVMRSMQKRYGKKKGTQVFYATVNKWRSHGTAAQKAAQPKRGPGQKKPSRNWKPKSRKAARGGR